MAFANRGFQGFEQEKWHDHHSRGWKVRYIHEDREGCLGKTQPPLYLAAKVTWFQGAIARVLSDLSCSA
jgi:hypothetical protein